MSTDAMFGQATHTLTIIGQQEPTAEHLRTLHAGYLSDLMRAIKMGTLPERQIYQKALGLLPEFQNWMTVQRGNHTFAESSRRVLEKAGCRISDWAGGMLDRADWSDIRTELDLVVASNADLGFPKGAKLQDTYDRARELGLELVPHWGAPAIREAYKNQSLNEWLLIATEAIRFSDDWLLVFNVVHHDGGLWLRSAHGVPDGVWNGISRFVFIRPRK
jgi:hypothetical protein